MSKPSEPPSVGQVLVTKDARLLGVGRTVKGCKFVNLDASTEVSDHSILGTEGRVMSFEQNILDFLKKDNVPWSRR